MFVCYIDSRAHAIKFMYILFDFKTDPNTKNLTNSYFGIKPKRNKK